MSVRVTVLAKQTTEKILMAIRSNRFFGVLKRFMQSGAVVHVVSLLVSETNKLLGIRMESRKQSE
jgi:hypothetical protein